MTVAYDAYYQTENLFGEPYPELIAFFTEYPRKGKVLDLGCGQGRDAIALARLGYAVTGIDSSKVGVEQMNLIGQNEKLNLAGQLGDIYIFNNFDKFDIALLDSMFHFSKKDKKKEIELVKKLFWMQKVKVSSSFAFRTRAIKFKFSTRLLTLRKNENGWQIRPSSTFLKIRTVGINLKQIIE
ncbi:MAG: hypothetical protein OHK0039_35150 [Bacteroidia bacterium]